MTNQQELNLISFIINKQFEYINEDIKYEDIPDDGLLNINGKKIRWWEYYLFKNKEQYLDWKDFAIKELKKYKLENKFDLIDMTYGLNYKLQKEKGQLDLF